MAIRKESIQIFDVAVPPPYVNKTTNTWWLYDAESEKYEDSKMKAVGIDGRSVVSITTLYRISDSNTGMALPTETTESQWSVTAPEWKSGKYIWSCQKIVYEKPDGVAYTGLKCSDEWTAVNDLEVGNRNYFYDKRAYRRGIITYSNYEYVIHSKQINDGLKLNLNDLDLGEYNLSFKIKIDNYVDGELINIGGNIGDNFKINRCFLDGNEIDDRSWHNGLTIPIETLNDKEYHEFDLKIEQLKKDYTPDEGFGIEVNRYVTGTWDVVFRVKNIIISAGNVKVDWTPSLEDIQARIDAKQLALEYLEKAIKQETQIDGALVTLVTMLLKEDMDAEVTAGISGIQGVNKDAPAVWGGGTYEDAIANVADWVLRHDGTGQLAGGMMWWTKDGKLYIGKKRANKLIMLSSETLAELEADTQTADNTIPYYENTKYANPTQDKPLASASNSYTTVLDLEYDAYVSGEFHIIVDLMPGGVADWGAEGNIELVNTTTNTVMETVWVTNDLDPDAWEATLVLTNRFLPKGRYEIRSSVNAGGIYVSGTPSIRLFIVHRYRGCTYDVKKLLIGVDGITIKDLMTTNYINFSLNNQDIIDVRGNTRIKSPDGKHILEITNSGIRKSNNSGASWVNL